MDIDNKIRETTISQLENIFETTEQSPIKSCKLVETKSKNEIKKLIDDIEYSIYKFSKEYAEFNNTPYLIISIYENKSSEILDEILNQNSKYLLNALLNKTINPKKIAKEDSDKKKIAELRKQAKEQRKMDLGRRLGPQRMDVETPAVLLTEDIPESFVRLKATVNPFEDRLRSLQERNLVEYRKPTKMRARYDIGTYVQRTGPKRCVMLCVWFLKVGVCSINVD